MVFWKDRIAWKPKFDRDNVSNDDDGDNDFTLYMQTKQTQHLKWACDDLIPSIQCNQQDPCEK